MIKSLKQIEELSQLLDIASKNRVIDKFKIIFDATNRISVFIKGLNKEDELSRIKSLFVDIKFEEVNEGDDSYDFLFDNESNIDLSSSRLHLSNILSDNIYENKSGLPVITFYSYKGGVGRSTSLASFASFLAIKKNMKVAILDCDFEAPGFSNFFLENPDNIYYKNGLVEYFLDSAYSQPVNLTSYCIEASKKFSGNGCIWVFPAGNLSTEIIDDSSHDTHLYHYLNGLSRLDVFSPDFLSKKFSDLFNLMRSELHPDIILIDSRTGFNDIFGITAFRLSNIVVGFFGNDVQTTPGLAFFLDNYSNNSPRLVVANAIIPSFAKTKLFNSFSNKVNDYLDSVQSEDDEIQHGKTQIKVFPIGYNDILKNIGLPTSSYEDYISLICNNEFSDYSNLFEYLLNCISESSENDSNQSVLSQQNTDTLQLRRNLLFNINSNMPSIYAESISDFDIEYSENRYFYRRCMEDLFNPDKFLILGNKGTGKTYIYRSLNNSNIVNELKSRSSKQHTNFDFIHIINDNHRFNTQLLDNQINSFPSNLFFERFWKIYIWSVLMDKYHPEKSSLLLQSDTSTATTISKSIKDDSFIIMVEKDLSTLDEELRSDNTKKRVIILFDELDRIVEPVKWSERISPLINFCRDMSYACISPKLFLRSDLYNKLTNINNKNELINRSISIEWTRDEIFAYFFKFIFSHSKDEFFKLLRSYDIFPNSYINKTIKNLDKEKYQPKVDEYLLRNLCSAFFGKYADTNNSPRYGESYDWFYNNLKNANDTISLRPFIDLIKYSVSDAVSDNNNTHTEKPILPANYYTNSRVRVKAVEQHFSDLAGEKGNTDLIAIFDYIRNKADSKYKKETISIDSFETLSDSIIKTGKLKDVYDTDSLLQLLIVNGIISEQFIRLPSGAKKMIKFALLYKYYLGLGSKYNKR